MALSPAALALMMQNKSNPRAVLSQVVSEMAVEDPQMALVSQYLAMQPAEEDEQEDSVDVLDATSSRPWVDDQEVMSLREEVASIQADLDSQLVLIQELLDRNNELARALGACPACWGEDRACSTCRGRGIPGAGRPDKKCFDFYLVPVLERMRTVNRARRDASRTDVSPN